MRAIPSLGFALVVLLQIVSLRADIDFDLIEASYLGHYDDVVRLIEQGADVNAEDDQNGWTALHEASMKGRLAIVKLLINEGAEVGFIDDVGNNALHKSAFKGHSDVTRVLIDAGLDVNLQDNVAGLTPLHRALQNGHRDVAKVLVGAGASLDIEDNKGESPRQLLFQHLDEEDVESILQAESANQATSSQSVHEDL